MSLQFLTQGAKILKNHQLVVSQVVSQDHIVIRVSKYQNEDDSIFYRTSAIINHERINFDNLIDNAETAKQLFEEYQKIHFGTIKQKFNVGV